MPHVRDDDRRLSSPSRLVWVGIIAAVAAFLSRLATESLAWAVVAAVAAALISVAIVAFVDRLRR